MENTFIRIPAILLALTIHEFAHGYVAYLRGDPTAKNSGRLSLNPLAHLDLLGTLMLFFGPFGWAKPVPVNSMNLKNPRKDIILVSSAGPISNILFAILSGIILRFFSGYFIAIGSSYLIEFFRILFIINLGLSFFNLIPIPPLDGSNIVIATIPPQKLVSYYRFLEIAPKILFGLLITEWLLKIPLFSLIINPLWKPYFTFWHWIVFK